MLPLIRINFLHLLRTRMVWAVLLFALISQYAGLSIISKINVQFNDVVQVIRSKDIFFGSVIFHLFTGYFAAAIYGIWMVPYLHRGLCGPLTHMLPIPRWKFPLSYCVSFLLLLLLQVLIGMFSASVLVREFTHGFSERWFMRYLFCLVGELSALTVVMIGFATVSLFMRPIVTFFLGLFFTLCSQLFALGERAGGEFLDRFASSGVFFYMRKAFVYGPPLGQHVFVLSDIYRDKEWFVSHFVLWLFWFGIFLLFFLLKLRYPSSTRMQEL